MVTDPIGQKFNRLTILSRVKYEKGHIFYKCECDCGSVIVTTRNNILRGNSTQCNSCGDVGRKVNNVVNCANENHYTYNSYRSMVLRCSEFDRYKNVPICDRWLEDSIGFLNFLEDMGQRPTNHTLDRIDNSKGYELSNCRWSTVSVQNHNKGKRRDSVGTYIGVSKVGKSGKFRVQLMLSGEKYSNGLFTNELDAATFYDNLSEQWYGDRPNKTERRGIVEPKRKVGGISFDDKSKKYRVRIFDYSNTRKTVGYYPTHEEATEVLELLQDMVHNR